MKIRNIDLGERPVLLAPMEDVTDQAFRMLCKEFGASMVYSEFVAADALVRNVGRSLEKIRVDDAERPVVVQIYGRDPETMAEAARIVEAEAHPDIIDINFGCPVKKIAGKGAGAGMLRTPELMLAITRAVVQAVKTPVTVKTRLGWDVPTMMDASLFLPDAPKGRPYIVELAERLQDCGIEALTIHGRTRSQMYQGDADWTLIGEVKRNPKMHIPIIGNGDICTAEQCAEAFDRYGVDAVMIGRATFGQPWLFRDVRTYLDTGKHDDTMTLDWKFSVLKRQVETSVAYSLREDNALKERKRTELGGIIHVRRHLANCPLFKGIPDFRQTRIKILQAETQQQLFSLLDQAKPLVAAFSQSTSATDAPRQARPLKGEMPEGQRGSTIIYPSPIFGPIHSRRLGVSLGINLMPADGKMCSFDCIYCECGLNKDFRPSQPRPTRQQVAEALEAQLIKMQQEGPKPDVFTFAGNGEPTMHPDFAGIIDDTLRLRDKYFPEAKVSVLTNSTMIHRDDVFNALARIDNNICKLDTVNMDFIRLVDQPAPNYDVDAIVQRLAQFSGRCIIQTMFLAGEHDGKDVSNLSDDFIAPWLEALQLICPREVMIYTIDRTTPVRTLQKATPAQLDSIADRVRSLGIECKVAY